MSLAVSPKHDTVFSTGTDRTERTSTTLSESGRAEGVGGATTTDPIVIVTAGDEGFALPMAVTLYSALYHLPATQTVEIIVLDSGISADSRRRIKHVVEETDVQTGLTWVSPDISTIEAVDLDMDPRFNASIFYRLLIPEVLPDTYTRVLYLDSDLVVEQNVQSLWGRPFEGNAVLAVPERTVSCPIAGVGEWERLGLDADAPFFNSGMMLMNLEAWRERDVRRRVIEYLLDPENRFCYPSDQEALNAVLAGQWGELDLRWNVTHLVFSDERKSEVEEMLQTDVDPIARNPYILHYTSDEKPWGVRCDHPYEQRFHMYLRQSGWFSEAGYVAWRSNLALRRGLHWLKEVSRPVRHRLGLRRH